MKKDRKNARLALVALFTAAVLSACAGTPPQWAESPVSGVLRRKCAPKRRLQIIERLPRRAPA
jgi:hypothetical protein